MKEVLSVGNRTTRLFRPETAWWWTLTWRSPTAITCRRTRPASSSWCRLRSASASSRA
jgi:hypothetical protein